MAFDARDSPFESYEAYVEALCHQSPLYRELKSGLEQSRRSQLGRVLVQDVRADGSYANVRVFAHNEPNAAVRLRDALSDRSPDLRTRVILVEYKPSERYDPFYGAEEAIPLSKGLWCEVGLKLDIEPLFFESSWNKGQLLRLRQYPHKTQNFLRMNYLTFKLIRSWPLTQSAASIGESIWSGRPPSHAYS